MALEEKGVAYDQEPLAPHSPEIEACQKGANTVFFESDNQQALATAMQLVYQNKSAWLSRRDEISRQIANTYTFESMQTTFLDAIHTFLPEIFTP